MPLRLDIVTIERLIYSGEVDMVIAPGIEGEMGILPHHAPLLTALKYGELRVRRGDDEDIYAIGGGFIEVLPLQVTVMADTAERAEEIDLERAEHARQRAQELLLDQAQEDVDFSAATSSLQRSLTRIEVARAGKRRRAGGSQAGRPSESR
jgi:F-type H+-transporting ATPase subunit epsilon